MSLNQWRLALPVLASAISCFVGPVWAGSPPPTPQGHGSPLSATVSQRVPAKNKEKIVPEGKARIAALKVVAGIVKKYELQKERGKAVYAFKIKAEKDGALRKVLVDAKTGVLIDVKKMN